MGFTLLINVIIVIQNQIVATVAQKLGIAWLGKVSKTTVPILTPKGLRHFKFLEESVSL